MNIFKKIFGDKRVWHDRYYFKVVVVPYAGDIAPGKEKEFEEAQRKALDELENLVNNEGYYFDEPVMDEGIHATVYHLTKFEHYCE